MIDNKLKKTMKCMMIGMSVYNVVLIIVSVIVFIVFYRDKENALISILKNETCIVIGFVLSFFAIYSMTISLSKAINANDEKFAKRHVVINSILRLIAFCIIMIIIINEKAFGLVGGMMFALSIFGIKVGAYLAPIIDKKI